MADNGVIWRFNDEHGEGCDLVRLSDGFYEMYVGDGPRDQYGGGAMSREDLKKLYQALVEELYPHTKHSILCGEWTNDLVISKTQKPHTHVCILRIQHEPEEEIIFVHKCECGAKWKRIIPRQLRGLNYNEGAPVEEERTR